MLSSGQTGSCMSPIHLRRLSDQTKISQLPCNSPDLRYYIGLQLYPHLRRNKIKLVARITEAFRDCFNAVSIDTLAVHSDAYLTEIFWQHLRHLPNATASISNKDKNPTQHFTRFRISSACCNSVH